MYAGTSTPELSEDWVQSSQAGRKFLTPDVY